jgi:hypothetical protein
MLTRDFPVPVAPITAMTGDTGLFLTMLIEEESTPLNIR